MGFNKTEAEQLLVDCGRRCCICGLLHRVQVHHIVPGVDDIENGIPLCPNCHDEVHTGGSRGRTTRSYSATELKQHRKRTISQVKREAMWTPGGAEWRKDKKRIAFFAQCLDRPAFRTYFHQEMSFSEFDQAMEDTIIALNTGYWKTRSGELIQRGEGKVNLVNPEWRKKLEQITHLVEEVRRSFSELFGLNKEMLFRIRGPRNVHHQDIEAFMEGFRDDRALGRLIDEKRQGAIDIMNSLLDEVGMQPLRGLREY